MKPIARFTTRLQGPGDGLFIGALLKSGEGAFKPNTVYEIREIMGELTIKEVGMGCGAGPDNCASNRMDEGKTAFHWGQDIGHILAVHTRTLFSTIAEDKLYLSHFLKEKS